MVTVIVVGANILVCVAGLSNMDGELFVRAGVTLTGADIITVPDIVSELRFVVPVLAVTESFVDLLFDIALLAVESME